MWIITSSNGLGGKVMFKGLGVLDIPEFTFRQSEAKQFTTKQNAQKYAKTVGLKNVDIEMI